MNKHFAYGFQIGCVKLTMSPLWLAAHILLFLICTLKDINSLPIGICGVAFWAFGYHKILLVDFTID